MNDVAKLNEEKAIVSAEGFDFDGPTGFEGVDRDCVTIPFLKIAQSATEQAKKGSPEAIKGLEPGMFFCPATRKVYGENVKLIIVKFYRQYIIYDGEGTDSKFCGTMSAEDFRKIESQAVRVKSYHMFDGKRYVDTRNFIVMVAGSLQDGPMLLSMSSTGIAPSRKWLTQAQNIRKPNGDLAPIYACVWDLATGYQDNAAGSYYQVTKVDRLGWITADAYKIVLSAFLDAGAMDSAAITGTEGDHAKPAAEASHSQTADDVSRMFGKAPAAAPTGTEDDVF